MYVCMYVPLYVCNSGGVERLRVRHYIQDTYLAAQPVWLDIVKGKGTDI